MRTSANASADAFTSDGGEDGQIVDRAISEGGDHDVTVPEDLKDRVTDILQRNTD